jgi:hypothetical protein
VVGVHAGSRNDTGVETRAVVADFHQASGVVDAEADAIRQTGGCVPHRVAAGFAECEDQIRPHGSGHPWRLEETDQCVASYRHGPDGRGEVQRSRDNHDTSPRQSRKRSCARSPPTVEVRNQRLFVIVLHICFDRNP